MKAIQIGDYTISRRYGIVNMKTLAQDNRKSKKIGDKIIRTALFRSRAEIKNWLTAMNAAESLISPNNTELIRVFKNIEIDLHLFAVMQTIRLKVISNGFFIYNADKSVNEELTELFKKKWFRKARRFIVDSEFYGFSLIQFGDIEGGIWSDAELVPREYVVQQKCGVKKNIGNLTDLISFNEPEFLNWISPVGERDNLGILNKAAPMIIKKKEVITAWSEAAEIFGMPMRVGKTNINDPERKKNMVEMLGEMGSAGWAVVDEEDLIEFIETTKTDFYQIYKEFIETVNSEISKAFLLQTGTTDEKSFTGSANVHENVLKDLIESYIVLVEEVTNEDFIPKLQRLGVLPAGVYFASDNEQKLSLEEMTKLVIELLKVKDIPAKWILETFNIPVEDKPTAEAPDPNAKIENNTKPAEVMKSVKNLYSSVLKSCCDADAV